MLNERLVAHRGYRRKYPENTLLAFDEARKAGARYIETDVQLSADLEPVLYHDLAMKRLSSEENLISNLPLSKIIATPAHEPERFGEHFVSEHIPSLAMLVDWLGHHPDMTVFVEIKRTAVALAGIEPCFNIVRRHLEPIADQVVLISFDRDLITHACRHRFCATGLVLTAWADLQLPEVTALALDYVFCDGDKIPGDADLLAIGPSLVIYEVDDWRAAMDWFKRGADLVETFDIGGLLHDLGHHAI